jgi:sterol carrier protein 2
MDADNVDLYPQPLGATGIGMLFYLTLQLRGEAGQMQAPNVKYALSHNIGLGGSCVVTVLRKADFYQKGSTQQQRVGYNVADECRQLTSDELNKVRSKQFSEYLPPSVPESKL